ncbi:hypothetical protein AB0N23_28660 [Streptomyces sp. NPDC052644]
MGVHSMESTLADLAVLKAGRVRHWAAEEQGAGKDGHRVGTVERFRTDACGTS